MSGKQETSAASTTSETIPPEYLSMLDLETELEKAKASLVTLGKRISVLKSRLNTPEQQFGDRASIADLQKKFISETHTFNALKNRLDSSQDDSDAAYQAAIASLLGGGEVFAAPLLELTAKEDSSNHLPNETVQPAEVVTITEQQTATTSTPPENPADDDDESEPETTDSKPKKNSHKRTKDSFLKVERSLIQVTIHEQLAGHCLTGKTTYLEIDALIAPLLNRRKIYYKDQELVDDVLLAKLASDAGYVLDILPSRKGHGGNKKSYRYFKKPSDVAHTSQSPDPEALKVISTASRTTSVDNLNGAPKTTELPKQATVFNRSTNSQASKPVTEKPATPATSEKKSSATGELSYEDVKTVISQSYSNYKDTFRRLVGAEPGEVSLSRAARVLIQKGFNFPSNAIRDYEIAIYDSSNWMITAPVFVSIYNLLMEKVAFDQEVGKAFAEVKAEEMAKVQLPS
ncbi:MAG: hypothetical protein QG639_912 [Patescibacteria group bacterium]|nr:hypothetical protein [Patescibacteria group bacterium]